MILRLFLSICLLVASLALPAYAEEARRVILVGKPYATRAFESTVTQPIGWDAVSTETAPRISEYSQYAAVVFLEQFPVESAADEALWNVGDQIDDVESYLKEGGRVMIIGAAFPRRAEGEGPKVRDLTSIGKLVGYAHYPKHTLHNPVQGQPAGEWLFEGGEHQFVAPYTITIGKLGTAQVLATVQDEENLTHPFATMNIVGDGRVYWFGTSPFRLIRETSEENSEVQAYGKILQKALQEP